MKRSALSEVERKFGGSVQAWLPWFLGFAIGGSVPLIILCLGWMIAILIHGSNVSLPMDDIQLGKYLTLPSDAMGASESPLRGALVLIAIAMSLSIAASVLLLGLYRWGMQHAIGLEIALRRKLYQLHVERAADQGIASQREAFARASSNWIPDVRDGSMIWYRSFHRYVTQALVSLAVAACIHPPLMLLTMLAFLLLLLLYRLLDRRRWSLHPILTDRSRTALERLETLTSRGPLLSSVHAPHAIEADLDNQLRTLRVAETQMAYSLAWRIPFLVALMSLTVALVLVVLTVQILRPASELNVAAAFTVVALIASVLISIMKVSRCRNRVRLAEPSAASLVKLVAEPDVPARAPSVAAASRLTSSLQWNNISFADSEGHLLLDSIHFQATPGQLIAIVSSKPEEARTMGELLLGFGMPTRGEFLWDGHSITQLSTASLNQQRMWIDGTGPLVSGTVMENLAPEQPNRPLAEFVDAARDVSLYEAVSELPETFSTMLSCNDDRLKEESLFRLGIARALLLDQRLIVAQEPSGRVANETRGLSLQALRRLTARQAIVFFLPLSTQALREADQVLLVHEKRLVGSGTHAELLERSDLYRHLNYLRFAPSPSSSTR